jgi:hypothetical protein
MPSLLRFARVMFALGVALYAGALALASWVEPHPREIVTELKARTPPAVEPQSQTKLRGSPSESGQTPLYASLKNLPLANN